MCRAVPRLAAHMLGYAGKSLVRRKIGEKVLSRYLSEELQAFSCWVLWPQSDLGSWRPSG